MLFVITYEVNDQSPILAWWNMTACHSMLVIFVLLVDMSDVLV